MGRCRRLKDPKYMDPPLMLAAKFPPDSWVTRISPNGSAIKRESVTDAVAPLLLPTKLTPATTKPLYLPIAAAASDGTSTFTTVADAEYEVPNVSALLYGFAL